MMMKHGTHAHARTLTHSPVQLVNEGGVETLRPVPQNMRVSGIRQKRCHPTDKKKTTANQK